MKEIPDSEFDKIFRERVQEYEPLFEEDAWNKMNRKLKRRDRIVFFRNTSMVLALLLLFGGGVYFYFRPSDTVSVVKVKKNNPSLKSGGLTHPDTTREVFAQSEPGTAENKHPDLKASRNRMASSSASRKLSIYTQKGEVLQENQSLPAAEPEITSVQSLSIHSNDLQDSDALNIDIARLTAPDTGKSAAKKKIKLSHPVKFGLAFSVGPDFNSVESIAGDKPTVGFGLLLNAAFTDKFSLSTGLRYSDKSYSAGAYEYSIKNTHLQSEISGIDASCNVLEIPLSASYTLMNHKKNSISVNGGLSSYFMLKEKYIFQYTPQSGIKDYTLEKRNANQHYLSIADLSVTYRIKLNNPRMGLGIEPYIKVPLGGVGEGKVHLKSSGVSLNLFYEIPRKK